MTKGGPGGATNQRRVALLAVAVFAAVVVSGSVLGASGGVLGLGGSSAPANGAATSAKLQVDGSSPVEGTRNLSASNVTLIGAGPNDTAGWSTASGDVNGDGVSDVIVGAPRNVTNGSNAGAVYLFYGPVNISTLSLADANATFVAESAGDRAGWSVAAGDVTGDGLDEILVGAPRADANGSNAGAVYVVNASAGPTGTVSLSAAESKLIGRFAGDHAGWSVDVVDNASADGTAGVFVGAPYADTVAPDAGGAFLVSATSLGGTVNLTNATATFYGAGGDDLAGWSVASSGDVNGDGIDDLLVGAPQNDTIGNDSGAAYLLDGQRVGTSILDSANLTLVGAGAGDFAGYSVAGAGDINNDTVPDLLVGSPLNDSGGQDAGSAAVVFGSPFLEGVARLADADVQLVGEGPGDRAGWSVASAGPANLSCDGGADLLVGAPYNDSNAPDAGAAYVVDGNATSAGLVNLANATAKLSGAGPNDRAGYRVAAGGDANGDGVSDLLIGAPFNDSGGVESGAVYLIYGACPEPVTTTTVTKTATATKTVTKTPTKTATQTATATKTATATATKTATKTATATATKTATQTATATKTATKTPTRTATATRTPKPIATPTVKPTATKTPKPRTTTPGHIATPTPVRTTTSAGIVVEYVACDAVNVTGEFGEVRLIVVGGPPQVFDASEGPTFYTEGGETIAIIQVFDRDGNLVVVEPRSGGVGDCVRRGAPGNPGNPGNGLAADDDKAGDDRGVANDDEGEDEDEDENGDENEDRDDKDEKDDRDDDRGNDDGDDNRGRGNGGDGDDDGDDDDGGDGGDDRLSRSSN